MFTGHTIRILYDDAIRPNTNRLFRPLFGTEANTNRIFGASLMFTLYLIVPVCSSTLPASGRRSRDRWGEEEVRTGRHTVTDGWRGSQRLRPTILLTAFSDVLI